MEFCYCGEPSFFYLRSREENGKIIQEQVNKCARLKYTTEGNVRKLNKKQACDFIGVKFYEKKNFISLEKKQIFEGNKVIINYRKQIKECICRFNHNIENNNECSANSCIGHLNYYIHMLGYKPFNIYKESIDQLIKRLSGPPDKKYTYKAFVSDERITDPFIKQLLSFENNKANRIAKPKKKKRVVNYEYDVPHDFNKSDDEESNESDFELDIENEEEEDDVQDENYVSDGGDFSD
jgi:hypothetical protein